MPSSKVPGVQGKRGAIFDQNTYTCILQNVLADNVDTVLTNKSGPGITSLVNISLKFQTLISQICQYFLLKKCEKLLQCKSFSHFFKKKISVNLVIKS